VPILIVHDSPGGTKEQYEQVGDRLTDGRGLSPRPPRKRRHSGYL